MIATLLATVLLLQAPKGEFKPFKSAKGEFTATFPGKPAEKKRAWKVGGKTVDLVIASIKRGVTTYEVAYGDLPADLADDATKALDAARDDVLKQLKGTLSKEETAEWKGHPARNVDIEVPRSVVVGGASGRARLLLVGKRLYMAVTLLPGADVAAKAADADAFLAALQPSEKAAAAKAAAPATTAPTATAGPGAKASGAMPAGEPSKVASAAKPAVAGWERVESSEGRFTAMFPGKPAQDQLQAQSAMGAVRINKYALSRPSQLFAITYQDFPQEAIDSVNSKQIFDSVRDDDSKKGAGTLVGEASVDVGGFRGRDLQFELAGGGIVRLRMILVKTRVFTLTYSGAKGSEQDLDVVKFFELFKPTDAPPAAGLNAKGTGKLAGWVEFESVSAGFKALFPRKPEGGGEVSGAGEARIFQVIGDSTIYSVTMLPVGGGGSAKEAARLYKRLRDSEVVGGVTLTDLDVTVNGLAGHEHSWDVVEQKGAFARTRRFLVGGRLFAISYRESKKGDSEGRGDAFLDTFTITAK